MRVQFVPVLVAFFLGACATAAVQSNAAPPPDADPAAPPAEMDWGATTRRLVVAVDEAPVRRAPNDQASVTMLARGDNAFVARLEMQPGAAVPEHADPTEEYIHILEGTGTITIDGTEHEVGPGTTIYMPPGATVSYQNGDAPMSAIQVFAGPAPAQKYEAWTPVSDRVKATQPG